MFGFTRTAAAVFVAGAMLIVATLPSQADTGAVRFRVGSAGFIIGVGGGSGTLTFRGKTYPLRIGGVSIGMIGVSSTDLVGRARNLRRASDIAGNYTRWVRALPLQAARRLPGCRMRMALCLR